MHVISAYYYAVFRVLGDLVIKQHFL